MHIITGIPAEIRDSSHEITTLEVQLLANLVHIQDPTTPLGFAFTEINEARGTETVQRVFKQIRWLMDDLGAEYKAAGDPYPEGPDA